MSTAPALPESMVDVHYGHLCTVRVAKFDIVDSLGSQVASVVFQVQANKTRAYRSFAVRIAYEPEWSPTVAVRAAWRQLTGQDISLNSAPAGTGDSEQSESTPGQAATFAEIKEFVLAETRKLGADLTLDIV